MYFCGAGTTFSRRCSTTFSRRCSCVAAKTKLLELGGTVSVERVGGPDHEPIFQAVAELAGQRVMAKAAGTKSSIERRVAAQLLNTVFADDY